MTLNTPLEYEIQLIATHVLTVKVRKPGTQAWKVLADSAQKAQALDPAWEAETCYFKAGCYMFDPSPTDAPPRGGPLLGARARVTLEPRRGSV